MSSDCFPKRRSGGDKKDRISDGNDINIKSEEHETKRKSGGDEIGRKSEEHETKRKPRGDEMKFTCMLNSKNQVIIKIQNRNNTDDIEIFYEGRIIKKKDGIFKIK